MKDDSQRPETVHNTTDVVSAWIVVTATFFFLLAISIVQDRSADMAGPAHLSVAGEPADDAQPRDPKEAAARRASEDN